MPVVGLGTGGYSHARNPQATPEVCNISHIENAISNLKYK